MKTTGQQRSQRKPYMAGLIRRFQYWRSRLRHTYLPKQCFFFSKILLLWLSLTVLNTGMILSGRTSTLPLAPFATYADVFPGNPQNALNTYPTTCFRNHESSTRTETCRFRPKNQAFSYIDAHTYNDKIQTLDFIMRDGALRVGDLILLWGKPNTILEFHDALHFVWWKWDQIIGARTPYAHYPAPSLPVLKVYMMTAIRVEVEPEFQSEDIAPVRTFSPCLC